MFWLELRRNPSMPYIRQLCEHLRLKILGGDLAAGARLPSTRDLALQLRVSRNVVREAYAQLAAEGYLESRRGAGMFVAAGARLPARTAPTAPAPAPGPEPPGRAVIDFRTGAPALELVPRALLARRFREACLDAPAAGYGYGSPGGHPALRQALAVYLARTRGVHCSPECILITTGTAEAIYLAARLLLGPRTGVVVEDPLHAHFQDTLRFCGADLLPIPGDGAGLQVALLDRVRVAPAFVLASPSHAFPCGATLPVQRRIELLRFGAERGCPIVEDDHESEFHYGATAASSLQGLNPDGVIYLGTFSKVFSPSLRIGYMVLPARFMARIRELKYLVNNHASTFDQMVVARLLQSGELERHVAAMKRVYRKRQEALLQALAEAFGGRCACSGTSAGLHLLATFAGRAFTPALLEALAQAGVLAHPVERHAIRKGEHLDQLILGFGNLPESRIREGVRRMRGVLEPD